MAIKFKMSEYHVCVDAGGTKVACAIADSEGNIVAQGIVGPGNMAELGVELSFQRITQAVCKAIQNAPLVFGQDVDITGPTCPIKFQSAWAAIAGCDSDLDIERMSARLDGYFGIPTRTTNDSLLLASDIITDQIEHDDTEEPSWGVCVVAGTGSVITGVQVGEDGVPVVFGRMGGHGHIFGDEGSAYHLGVTAVRIMANAANCDEDLSKSEVVKQVCQAVGVNSPSHLPSILHELDHNLDVLESVNRRKLRIAGLAIPIIAAATTIQPNDPIVQSILNETTSLLARDISQIVKLARKRGLRDHKRAMLCVTGGLAAQPVYLASLTTSLQHDFGIIFGTVVFVENGAIAGAEALAIARRAQLKP